MHDPVTKLVLVEPSKRVDERFRVYVQDDRYGNRPGHIVGRPRGLTRRGRGRHRVLQSIWNSVSYIEVGSFVKTWQKLEAETSFTFCVFYYYSTNTFSRSCLCTPALINKILLTRKNSKIGNTNCSKIFQSCTTIIFSDSEYLSWSLGCSVRVEFTFAKIVSLVCPEMFSAKLSSVLFHLVLGLQPQVYKVEVEFVVLLNDRYLEHELWSIEALE